MTANRKQRAYFTSALLVVIFLNAQAGSPVATAAPGHKCDVRYESVAIDVFGKSVPVEIYRPTDGKSHPLILLVHGSAGVFTRPGYGMPADENFGEKTLAEECFATALPHYFEAVDRQSIPDVETLRADFPALLAALTEMLNHLSQAPDLAGQPIGLYGESYGAYLAFALAARDSKVRAVSEYSGGVPSGYSFARKPPPFLIQHGENDDLVPVGEAYRLRSALRKSGGRVELHAYSGESHYFSATARSKVLAHSVAFFDRHLRVSHSRYFHHHE